MKHLKLILLSFLVIACSKDSLEPKGDKKGFLGEIAWVKSFGGSGYDTAQAVIKTIDGGFAILGYSNSVNGDLAHKTTAVNDYWLLKLDNEGNLEWSKTYGGSDDDIGKNLIQTADGGFGLIGYSRSSDGDASNNEGFHDNWVVKLDASGSIQWERSFGFSGHDHSYDIVQTTDGGFFFAGFLDVTASNGEGNYGKRNNLASHGVGEFWGTKLTANGDLEWRRFFGGSNNDRAHGVVQANDGGFLLSGFSESDDFDISNTKGSYDFWMLKINSQGDLLWERSFGGTGIEISYDIAKTLDQAYIITGNTFSSDTDVSKNNGESDVWLIKVDDNGNLLWEKTFGGTRFDAAQSVHATADGGYVISGNSKSTDGDLTENAGENDFWILKTDKNGTLLWQKTIGGSHLDFGFDALETFGNKLLMVGESQSTDFPKLQPKGEADAIIIMVH